MSSFKKSSFKNWLRRSLLILPLLLVMLSPSLLLAQEAPPAAAPAPEEAAPAPIPQDPAAAAEEARFAAEAAASEKAAAAEAAFLAHVHIVLNHIPSLGSIAGLILLAAAIYTKNDQLKKFAFAVLVFVTLAVLPTYITGAEAQRAVSKSPSVSLAMIQVHQNAAMLTLVGMTFAGAFAWFGLWEFRRFTRAGSLTTMGTLVFGIVSVFLILNTASLGGKVSHPEVRAEADAAVAESAGWRDPIELFVNDHGWMWPALETMHFIGMALLFGVSLLLLLRMLGAMKSIPFTGLHRLLPMGVVGFVVNVLTGMLFFIASPGIYLGKLGFHIKIASIVVAAIPLLYFTLFDEPWQMDSNQPAPLRAKLAAVGTFALLITAMIYGRFLPFLS
jgi:uncharacterized membrane protein